MINQLAAGEMIEDALDTGANEIEMKRIERLLRIVQEKGFDGVLVDDPINLFYYTGLQLSSGKLVVGEKSRLYVDGRCNA